MKPYNFVKTVKAVKLQSRYDLKIMVIKKLIKHAIFSDIGQFEIDQNCRPSTYSKMFEQNLYNL